MRVSFMAWTESSLKLSDSSSWSLTWAKAVNPRPRNPNRPYLEHYRVFDIYHV
jgi:hypothetical protein